MTEAHDPAKHNGSVPPHSPQAEPDGAADAMPRRDPAVNKALDVAILALRSADAELAKLQAISAGAEAIEVLDLFGDREPVDHLSDVAIHIYGLNPNLVQIALANGIERARKRLEAGKSGKASGPAGAIVIIDELARLNRLDYEKQRMEAAKQQGIRSSALDDAVERRRSELAVEHRPAPLFDHWVVEPWPNPVDGGALMLAITGRIDRHVVLGKHKEIAVALWTMMAWVHQEVAIHSPILLATSAEPNSGKTTLVNLVGFMVPRGLSSVGISEAALFRSIELHEPTLIVDEADVALVENEPLRAVFNSGWTRGSGVLRCVGDDNTPHLFPTFCPKIIGMKGRKLPDTTMSRCIVIELQRKKPSERVEYFDHRDDPDLGNLRRQALRWSMDNVEALKAVRPAMPAGFENRLGDNWRLMLAIADLVGGEWPDKARQAAMAVARVDASDDASTGVKLLTDIHDIFAERGIDRLRSEEIIIALVDMENRPWGEWKAGRPITQRQLARLLKPFQIYPRAIRAGDARAKGYLLDQFSDAFERYLPADF
jgi:putative DNA primase/helicase